MCFTITKDCVCADLILLISFFPQHNFSCWKPCDSNLDTYQLNKFDIQVYTKFTLSILHESEDARCHVATTHLLYSNEVHGLSVNSNSMKHLQTFTVDTHDSYTPVPCR